MLFQLQPGMSFNPVCCEFSVHESTIAMWWRVFKQKLTENMAVQRLGPHPRPLRDRGLSVLSSGRVGSRSQGLSVLGAAPGPGIRQRGRTELDFTPEPSPPAGRLSLEIEGVCRAQRSSVGEASPLTMTQSPPGRSIHLFLASQLSLSLLLSPPLLFLSPAVSLSFL